MARLFNRFSPIGVQENEDTVGVPIITEPTDVGFVERPDTTGDKGFNPPPPSPFDPQPVPLGGKREPILAGKTADGAGLHFGSPAPITASPVIAPVQKTPIGNPNFQADQAELERLQKSGSGIDQILHPVDAQGNPDTSKKPGFWKKLGSVAARIGDVAGAALFPTIAAQIPGTTMHHQLLVNRAAGRVANDLETEKEQSEIEQSQAQTAKFNADANRVEPGTPEQQAFDFLVRSGASPADAFKKLKEMSDTKPDSIEHQVYDYMIQQGKTPVEAFGAIYEGKNTKDKTLQQQYLEALQTGDSSKASLIKRVIHDTSTQPKIEIKNSAAGGGAGAPVEAAAIDPTSQSILAQTGLSLNAFRVLTGRTSELPRDAATRNAASKEANEWANKHGVDVSTLSSQYKSYNDVLAANIARMSNTRIMENELEGTIQNLRQVANDKDLSKLKFVNVAKVWAGQETNDDLAQQYAMHLNQLRNELAAYNAATQGRTGNNITVQDWQEAERTIKNGVAKGSLDGLEKAVKNSTEKMGTVMQGSVDAAGRAVWNLFGVGKNYRGGTGKQFSVSAPNGKTYSFDSQEALDNFKKSAGIK